MRICILFDYTQPCLWLDGDDVPIAKPVYVNSEGYFASDYYPVVRRFADGSYELGEKIVWKYPEERLKGQYELERKVNYINETYSKLFIDNEVEFSYKGFDSEEDERIFDDAVRFVYKKLVELLGADYEIINKTTIDMLIE